MKKYLYVVLLFPFLSFTQNLNLDELISLTNKDFVDAEEYLTSKNWSFVSVSHEDSISNLVQFSYNKNEHDDFAEAILTYFYIENTNFKSVFLKFSDIDVYNLYISRIKSLKLKLINSNIIDNEIKKVYQGNKKTIIVGLETQKSDLNATNTIYSIMIVDKEYYKNKNLNNDINIDDNENNKHILTDYEFVEENYKSSLKKDAVLSKSYFVGKWIDENSVFSFLLNGDLVLKHNFGEELRLKWKFEENILLIIDEKNGETLKYHIIYNDSQSFSYNIDENSKIYTSYKL